LSWQECQDFTDELNALHHGTFALPTEAQWEYACRAGSTSLYCFGDDPYRLHFYAWYEENGGGELHPVGMLRPNTWGLYDMHGNVLEWCRDFLRRYHSASTTDPVGPLTPPHGGMDEDIDRIRRGGHFRSSASGCESGKIYYHDEQDEIYLGYQDQAYVDDGYNKYHNHGFRIVRFAPD
jgi:formylglycine-generating enzyme required for sulfatase activity